MTEPKPQDPPIEPVTGDETKAVLAALARADTAVRCHQEPRVGPHFEGKFSRWQRLYRKALAMGAQIEGGQG